MSDHYYELRPSYKEFNEYAVWKIIEKSDGTTKEYFYLGISDDDDLEKLREALGTVVDPWEPQSEVAV